MKSAFYLRCGGKWYTSTWCTTHLRDLVFTRCVLLQQSCRGWMIAFWAEIIDVDTLKHPETNRKKTWQFAESQKKISSFNHPFSGGDVSFREVSFDMIMLVVDVSLGQIQVPKTHLKVRLVVAGRARQGTPPSSLKTRYNHAKQN